ncbi:hypothetical protein L2E82_33429 [Cichorium intybus]|uniref:Uncharacterized protein n=1 Tax=Cichorium intybus TaxID=13427 RepID=A0ACB9BK46_CICIN|nr:hypothetical protein L2E82_33429 [Cichorium intybus]
MPYISCLDGWTRNQKSRYISKRSTLDKSITAGLQVSTANYVTPTKFKWTCHFQVEDKIRSPHVTFDYFKVQLCGCKADH